MNVLDEIRGLRIAISELNRLLLGIRRTAGGGETNTASNVGSAGTGLYDAKVGVDLQFRKINALSSKISVALDAPNKKVDLDIDPSQIDLDDLGDINAAAPNNLDVLTWIAAASEWQAQPGGGGGGGALNKHNFRKSGRYYCGQETAYLLSTVAAPRDILYAYPFIVPIQQSFDRLSVAVTTGQTGGIGELALYEDNGSVYPGDLVVESAELDFSSAGVKEQVISETLDPGLYWLVLWHDTYPNPSFRAINYNYNYPGLLGYVSPNDTRPYLWYQVNQSYSVGAIPDPFPGGATEQENINAVAVMLRKT